MALGLTPALPSVAAAARPHLGGDGPERPTGTAGRHGRGRRRRALGHAARAAAGDRDRAPPSAARLRFVIDPRPSIRWAPRRRWARRERPGGRASSPTRTSRSCASLAQERSVVAASRSVGISRDRAIYRLARLDAAFGGPVVAAVRGGRAHGGTRLTALGDRIVRQGFGSVELARRAARSRRLSLSNRLRGRLPPRAGARGRARAGLRAPGRLRRGGGRAGRRPGRPRGDPRRPGAVSLERAQRPPRHRRQGRTVPGGRGTNPPHPVGARDPPGRGHRGADPPAPAHARDPGLALREGDGGPAGERRPAYSRIPSVVSEKTASPSGRFGESMSRAIRRGGFDLRR